jgi:hypothetical protein
MDADQELERRGRAFRRAGYAVARLTQGRPLRLINLDGPEPVDEGPGERVTVDLGGGSRHRLEMELLARWAGLLSEGRDCRDDVPPPGGWGAAAAPLAAMGLRVTRSDDENEAYLEWLRRRALGLLDLPGIWKGVEAVGEALLKDGTVDERQARALVAGAQPPQRRPRWLQGFYHDVR